MTGERESPAEAERLRSALRRACCYAVVFHLCCATPGPTSRAAPRAGRRFLQLPHALHGVAGRASCPATEHGAAPSPEGKDASPARTVRASSAPPASSLRASGEATSRAGRAGCGTHPARQRGSPPDLRPLPGTAGFPPGGGQRPVPVLPGAACAYRYPVRPGLRRPWPAADAFPPGGTLCPSRHSSKRNLRATAGHGLLS